MVLNQEDADMVKQGGRSSGVFIAGRQYFSQHQLNDRKIIGGKICRVCNELSLQGRVPWIFSHRREKMKTERKSPQAGEA